MRLLGTTSASWGEALGKLLLVCGGTKLLSVLAVLSYLHGVVLESEGTMGPGRS